MWSRELHIYIASMENTEKKTSKNDTWSALSFAWNLGYSIAIPLVLLALGGRFLDRKLGTSPWMLLGGILVSIIISSFIVYRKTIKLLKQD